MSEKEIQEVLKNYRVIAVVGLSSNQGKPSYKVAAYMKQQGYRIIPVNPKIAEVLGEKSYPSLLDLPEELAASVEVVDVFRRAEDVPAVVDQTVALKHRYGKPFVVWMQQGIVNESAAVKARKAGLVVVMDRCIMVEHRRFC